MKGKGWSTRHWMDRKYCKKAPVRVLFSLLRQSGEHIFDKDAVAAGGIAHENVGHRADELSVLDDGGAAHECVNIGPTIQN